MTITQNNGVVYSQAEILSMVKKGTITIEEADKLLDKAKAKGNGQSYTVKVSEKGCVQLRGVPGASIRFGLSLYPKTIQWLYEHKEELEKFIETNKDSLSWEKAPKE